MSLEIPTLRIGLAGFGPERQERFRQLLAADNHTRLAWELARLGEADVFLVNGANTQLLDDGRLRVAAAVPGVRPVQFALSELDRPVAFSLPLAQPGFEPDLRFDHDDLSSLTAVLLRFEALLAPLVAQFCLASQIIDQEGVLGAGVYHVTGDQGLLAVVNLRGPVALLPTASARDVDGAMWVPVAHGSAIPDHFSRTTLSQLMWQYALRTTRDVLPPRYRTGLLYFRRPPRLPQRALLDAHLLLLRELASGPATFTDLQRSTGLGGTDLARALAALYLVGAITSNPKRAAQPAPRRSDAGDTAGQVLSGDTPSVIGSESGPGLLRTQRADLTAPAPLSIE